ncbi:MAG: chorismate lyase [Gammaproteobacteria bacterium]|nr:chorismate lyase [Gammaproteobacteria bacterium]
MKTNLPVWRAQQQILASAIPESIRCWLFDPGSLTARAIAACRGKFRVEVVAQAWRRASVEEARRLTMPRHALAWVREVYLYCNDTPWVFARTVIPRRTLSGRQKPLAHLGSRPLGAVLFADPWMRRDPIEVCCLNPQHQLFAAATHFTGDGSTLMWGRRSVFYLDHKPLLVNEIFLPSIARCKLTP